MKEKGRLLVSFDQPFLCTQFDSVAGCGKGLKKRRDKSIHGFCVEEEFGWVAVYAEDDLLVVQIAGDCFILALSEVTYEHDPDSETTRFKIAVGVQEFEHHYPSWWMTKGSPDPYDYLIEDEDNDIFGYIAALRDKEEAAGNLAELWSGEARRMRILCPYCLGEITAETVHCGHCGDDVRNDSAFELSSIHAIQMRHSGVCAHCEGPMGELAIKCPHCRHRRSS